MAVRLGSGARSLLRRQRGLLARWQGRSVGIDSRVLKRAADRGDTCRWVGQRTIAFGASALGAAQRRVLACLEAGGSAALGGIGALQEAGWSGEAPNHVDVAVPRNYTATGRRLPPWVRLHYVSAPVTVTPAVRCLPAARSLVDAAAWARSDREATFIVLSALQGNVVPAVELAAELSTGRRTRRARLVRELLAGFNGGVTTIGELEFVRACRDRGLPTPAMQVRRVDATGRVRVVDAEFEGADGCRVMVEIDGAGHRSVQGWTSDMARHNDLALVADGVVLRVSNWQIRYEPDMFFEQLAIALGPDRG